MNTLLARFAGPVVAGLVFLAAPLAGATSSPVEGVHYRTLKPAQPTNVAPGKVEVVGAFWYACGHCYLLEPRLEAWEKKGRAPYVQLVRLPAVWNPLVKSHAQLYYTIEALGRPDLHAEVFREMNVPKNLLETPEKMAAFLAARGVPKADFEKTFAGFAVDSNVKRAVDLNKRYRITSTPTVIVNGKYVTDAGMAGSEEKLFEVINALAAREQKGG
jgi:thiol:disulfide interchange protein DsbA